MQEKFPTMGINKEKIQNRMKTVKKNFSRCYDIFKTGLSGFTINPQTGTWDAEPEVWAELIKHHPEAEEWRTKPVKHYEKLVILYGQDRANGEGSLNVFSCAMKKKSDVDKRSTDPISTIDEVDYMVSQNHVHLENISASDNSSPTRVASHVQPEDSSSHKAKKGKKSVSRESLASLSGIFEKVANAITNFSDKMANAIMAKNMKPSYDIWGLVKEIGLEEELMDDAFVFLSKHPSTLESLIMCPADRQKIVLKKFMNTPN